MIPIDFSYWRPTSAEEAVALYQRLAADRQEPAYCAGGTEIVTRARLGQLAPGAVIDLKAIPEMCRVACEGGRWHFGAAVPLAQLVDDEPWPLLARIAERVADHTSRAHITLGGNLAGAIQYREAALPFWLADAEITVAGPHGRHTAPFAQRFGGALSLDPGELVLDLSIPESATRFPSYAQKATRLDYVDYPLVTVAAVQSPGGHLRVAWSGLLPEPFRSDALDAALSAAGTPAARVARALGELPSTLVEDLHGTADYRRFVCEQILSDAIADLEGT